MVLEQKKKHFEKVLERNISHIIHRKTKDPRIGFVTLTRISLSNDLHNAKIYISILGSKEEREKCLKGLHSATNFIRTELAHELKRYRFTPSISFHFDTELEKTHQLLMKIEELNRDSEDREN